MYQVSKAKLDELNALINVGGTIPGEVSNALAALQPYVPPEGKKAFDAAVNANKLNTPAWENVQKWHDTVAKQGNTPDPGPVDPPPPTSSGSPLDPIPADGKSYKFQPFVAGQKITSHAGGDGRFTFTSPVGSLQGQVWINGVEFSQKDYAPCKAGDLIEWMLISPEYQDECIYTLSLPA